MSDLKNEILSVVIPCFNEEETLAYTHKQLITVFAPLGYRFVELLYVNDGSSDNTSSMLNHFYQKHESAQSGITVTIVEFSRNFGHSAAVLAGLSKAKGDYIAIIDADLQDPPEIVPEMLAECRKGFDVVYGVRARREKENAFKKTTVWLFYRILNLLAGFEIPRDTGDFRVMTRQVRDAILECSESDLFIRGIVAWVGFRQKPYPYTRKARQHGQTKYPLRRMLRFAFLAILSFSSTPLRLGLYLGVLGILTAFGLLSWVVLAWYRGHTVPGWASLLAAFLGGQSFILTLLGIMGAYLGRVYTEVQRRPRFIIRSNSTNLHLNSR